VVTAASQVLSSAVLKELEGKKNEKGGEEKKQEEEEEVERRGKVMEKERADAEGAIKRTDDGGERENRLIYCVDFCTF